MIKNNYGELIYDEDDIIDMLMKGRDANTLKRVLVTQGVNLDTELELGDHVPELIKYFEHTDDIATFDAKQQENWHMPQAYKDMDIAQHILGLCETEVELQRCGEELLLYQERDLFNLLKYLKYLVDTMTENKIIWGVGRGSSVASYVLYKLKVHRINSIFYKLDIKEFLR
jgi:DNA polymerase III alpha subunit